MFRLQHVSPSIILPYFAIYLYMSTFIYCLICSSVDFIILFHVVKKFSNHLKQLLTAAFIHLRLSLKIKDL